MRVLGLDPGPTQSALVILGDKRVLQHSIESNLVIVEHLAYFASLQQSKGAQPLGDVLVIEQIASFGMPVGAEVFETCWWSGRFAQAWHDHSDQEAHRLKRHEVKSHLCHNQRAKDANIRQALIDRFGGDSAIGRKAHPGPLYGLRGDEWTALSVAIVWKEQHLSKTNAKSGVALSV
jgi:hypothetical protein